MSKHGQSIGPYVPSAQVKLTNVAYVKLQSHGHRFEIACYRNKVLSWKNKVETDIGEVLQIDKVYTNVSRGILASTEHLMEVFGSINQLECCKKILERGEMQVTEQEREALVESTFRDVVAIVADKSVNPDTNRSYTTTMIQNAMKQLHINVVTSRSVKAQALEVIRKLKEVMPIARASMALRVVSPIPEEATMKSKISEDLGLQILKESRTADMVYLDIRIDPEMYKKIEESVQILTKGQGRVEVTQFRDSAPPALNLSASIHSKEKQTRNDNSNDESTESGGGGGGADSAAKKPSKLAGKSISFTKDTKDTKDKEVDESRQKKSQAAVKSKSEGPDNEDSDGSSDEADEADDAENAVFEFAKGKNSDSVGGGGGSGGASADSGVIKVANKKSKRNKRIEKEEMKEKEKRLNVIRERVHLDQARSSASASAHQVIAESSSEGVNHTGNIDNAHNNSSNNSNSINNSNASVASSSNNNSKSATPPATTGGQKCNTCGGSFTDATAYRNHFRSEWHRHNLKRKMKNLPVINSEEDFLKLPIEELEI